jgi:hypothetical protein
VSEDAGDVVGGVGDLDDAHAAVVGYLRRAGRGHEDADRRRHGDAVLSRAGAGTCRSGRRSRRRRVGDGRSRVRVPLRRASVLRRQRDRRRAEGLRRGSAAARRARWCPSRRGGCRASRAPARSQRPLPGHALVRARSSTVRAPPASRSPRPRVSSTARSRARPSTPRPPDRGRAASGIVPSQRDLTIVEAPSTTTIAAPPARRVPLALVAGWFTQGVSAFHPQDWESGARYAGYPAAMFPKLRLQIRSAHEQLATPISWLDSVL